MAIDMTDASPTRDAHPADEAGPAPVSETPAGQPAAVPAAPDAGPDAQTAGPPDGLSREAAADVADAPGGGPDDADRPDDSDGAGSDADEGKSDEGKSDEGKGGEDKGGEDKGDEGKGGEDKSGEDKGDEGKGGEDKGDEGKGGEDGGGAPDGRKKGKAGRRERPTLVIRYGRMRFLGRFRYALDRWRRGQRAVIKSDRGIEIGTIICRAVAGCCGDDLRVKGEVLRLVTHSDEVDERHLEKDADREFAFCKERVAARTLPMKVVAVEHLFGGDRIIFYFVAEKRVDFRALVRDLAREFQTRIEMRQIGVRDEARLLGDYERCGRPLCCRAFIRDLEPVSMKMAKVQKATLDPSKISGRCGRLMCCLRFEHSTYRELQKNLPRKNKEVGTAVGRGKVLSSDVVTQTVTVLLEGGTRVVVPVETLVAPEEAGADRAQAPAAKSDGRVSRQAGRRGDRRNRAKAGAGSGGGSGKDEQPNKEQGATKDAASKQGDGEKKGNRRRRSKGKRRGRKKGKTQGDRSTKGGGTKNNRGGTKA